MEEQRIGTCIVLVNNNQEILLGKRKNAYSAGSYGLPGGRIEVNEPMSDSIKREVLEETGIELNYLDYIGVVRENQGDYDFIHFVFYSNIDGLDPKLCEPEKCEGWEWHNDDFGKGNILPGHAAAIELYLNKKRLIDITQ